MQIVTKEDIVQLESGKMAVINFQKVAFIVERECKKEIPLAKEEFVTVIEKLLLSCWKSLWKINN